MNTTSTIDIIAIARQLAADFATRAEEADKQAKLPSEDVKALTESGYVLMSVPREYGGMGLTLKECVEAQLELAKGSTSSAMVAGMQIHMFGNVSENRPWSEAAFERMSRAAVAGGLFNTAASEPTLGSPSRGGAFETNAVRSDVGWVINGHKTWTTGGKHLTHIVVRLDVEGESAVIVIPANTPGVEWVETWGNGLSLRASDSHDVYFKDVVVPEENLLERGKRDDKTPNAWFPMIMAAVYLGTAIAARDAVIQFGLERIPTALGKPITTLPKIQRQIGEIDLALMASRALMLEVASQWTGDERSKGLFPRIAAAKHMATETANMVTDKALQIAGGTSLTRDLPLERFFRDTRAGLMQPPSGDTALEIVGRGAIEQISKKMSEQDTA
ncbi:MAG: acyl-CoA/acyl-ACP dehydrogenase [Anaerolineae bacterium]|nr:acyl-CoA/acyl-ACP dehydrogenase [Anaerolineae bacterium]